ncbi:WD40 repeat domain-containing protein [Longispora sp. NPDC051575]|uniref:WD40 repeat domain-containing protein n=1 Tax=Longispora sp. NPDC051575 TaxID=3154943 RepID=UPI0034420C12
MATRWTEVAVGAAGGRTVAVVGGEDGSLLRFDVDTLAALGGPVAAHDGSVDALATTVLGGRPVLVSAGGESLRLWELETGAPLAGPVELPYDVTRMCVTTWNDLSVAVCLHSDGLTRVYDLVAGALAAGPLDDWAGAVALAEWDGQLVAVLSDHPFDEDAGDYDFDEVALQAWDLAEGSRIGGPLLDGGFGGVVVDPPALLVGHGTGAALVSGVGADGHVRAWDLASGEALCEPLPVGDEDENVSALAAVRRDGRTLVLAGTTDGAVRLWDLAGAEIGAPFAPLADWVAGVALTERHGRLAAIAVGLDGVVRVWEPLDGGHVADLVPAA